MDGLGGACWYVPSASSALLLPEFGIIADRGDGDAVVIGDGDGDGHGTRNHSAFCLGFCLFLIRILIYCILRFAF
jgi:hypothetical protein